MANKAQGSWTSEYRFDKETKNKVRFITSDETAVTNALYLSKDDAQLKGRKLEEVILTSTTLVK